MRHGRREEIIARVAALDIGKAELVCCVRVPGRPGGRRVQEVRTYSTMTRSLLLMADRLAELGVTRVVMEATSRITGSRRSTCWRRPGSRRGWSTPRTSSTCRAGPRPTSWTRCGCARSPSGRCCGPASCHRAPIRRLRDLTRYRIDLVGARTAEKQRVEKLLEDAQIKLSVVASDIFGVSGRAMLAALIAGQRDPKVLAADGPRPDAGQDHASWRRRSTGRFTDHHGFLLAKMLARIDAINADIADLDDPDRGRRSPLSPRRWHAWLRSPGSAPPPRAVIIAEIGVDMTRFPTAGAPGLVGQVRPRDQGVRRAKKGTGATGHGNRYLARVLGEAAVAAGRTDTFLGERYRRIARRRGKKKAIVAVGRSILVIIWHLLAQENGISW